MSYFLAHNATDVFHYGELLEGQEITTGQPNLEYFETLEELKERLLVFGVVYNDTNNSPEPQEPLGPDDI
jgi:hypothetical protein